MRQLTFWLAATVVARPAAAADVHELLEQLRDPKPQVHDAACKQLIAMGERAAGVLTANLDDEAANAHHRLSYIVDRAQGVYAPGDPWDRSRNVIEGTNVEVWLDGDTKHVRLVEGARRVHIIETSASIRIEVQGNECGGVTRETYTARDPQELVHKHWGAWDIYTRWGGGVGKRWSVEGHTLTGARLEERGPIVRRTVMRNFDVLRTWVRGQMEAAAVPAKRRARVEKQLRAGLEALAGGGETAAKVQAFVKISDELRRAMAAANLPDPGELLPPPAHIRLGVTTSSEADGTRVDSVAPDSRGARIGLEVGDVILEVQGRTVPRRGLARTIRAVGEERLTLKVRRDGRVVKLTERNRKRRRR
jgi:hypothetical protein